MDNSVVPLEMDSLMKEALEVFERTRFAFIPILTKKEDKMDDLDDSFKVVTASLAIRDILPLIAEANLNIPIRELSSQLISLDARTSIRIALDYMLNNGIRNIGIKSNLSHIINDRKILEFLLSHNGRMVLLKNGIAGLADLNIVDNLDIISATSVKSNTPVSRAAELLMDIHNPCLILENNEKGEYNYVVTPWDIVMKTLLGDDRIIKR
jgi:CBS domain-containing protein